MCHKELVSLIFPVLRCDIQSLHVHYSMLLQLFFPVLCTQVNLELQLSKNHLHPLMFMYEKIKNPVVLADRQGHILPVFGGGSHWENSGQDLNIKKAA